MVVGTEVLENHPFSCGTCHLCDIIVPVSPGVYNTGGLRGGGGHQQNVQWPVPDSVRPYPLAYHRYGYIHPEAGVFCWCHGGGQITFHAGNVRPCNWG